jgi:hypothetical protein
VRAVSEKAVGSKSAMSRTGVINIHQAHELIQRLEKVGFDSAWAQRIITNHDYAQRIASFIREGGQQETVSQQKARQIMDERFLGIRELAEYLGVILDTEELKRVVTIPFKEETLQKYKDTNLLFLGVGWDASGLRLTLNQLRKIFPKGGEPHFDLYEEDKGSWFDLEIFARSTTPELKWYLIRTEILEESRSEGFDEQMRLLRTNEYLENAVVYVYAKILFFLARGISIFNNTFTRCDDVREERRERSHNHVAIGSNGVPYGSCGITVGYTYDGEEDHKLGIAPAVIPGA